ncbi:hypothetical protein DW226_00840 [Coprobacillus sp. AM18-4LB-d2]|nr:hypothetical protein DW226_00840 [Coprobacillus sp. AM18-4LB-d2]
MDKFNKELEKAKNPWIKRIGNYLLSRDDIQENLKKKNKSLDECFNYVLNEISKKCVKNGNIGYVAGDDQELFDLAVHYYDEDDIKVSKPNFRTNANGTATKKDMDGISSSKKLHKGDKQVVEKTPILKKKVIKKKKINENQMSLDDFLDFGA